MADGDSKRNWRFQDLTGQRFNRLTVVAEGPKGKNRATRWICRCDCGGEALVVGPNLKRGITRSCGCIRTEIARARLLKHGVGRVWARTPEYRAWVHMRSRCNNAKSPRFVYYGGRGIKVCERWDSFETFLADMGQKPSPKHSLDRIDVDGDYCPENCRWTTQDRQMQNTTRTVLSEEKVREIWRLRGEGHSQNQIARLIGTSKTNIQHVLRGFTWRRLNPNLPSPLP